MHYRIMTAAVALGVAGLAASGTAAAQSTTSTTTDSWRMPYQSGFWGHAGASIGRGELDARCIGVGLGCDQKDDRVFRVFAGGRFNNAVGLEVGGINIGDYDRGGGRTDGWGIDLALVAGFPIGANSSIFGKLGTLYSRTDVSGSPAGIAAGLRTGEESGWGARWGIGGQIGLSPQWALRLDWDRYQVQLPGSKEDLDTIMLGAQYNFR